MWLSTPQLDPGRTARDCGALCSTPDAKYCHVGPWRRGPCNEILRSAAVINTVTGRRRSGRTSQAHENRKEHCAGT